MDGYRRTGSRVLAESKRSSQIRMDRLEPGRRMEVAFSLSMDALKMMRAGLKAQGFPDAEIREQLRSRRR